MSNSYRKKKRGNGGLVLLVVFIAAMYFVWQSANRIGPADAYTRAIELVGGTQLPSAEKVDEATDLLELAKQNDLLSAWSALRLAQLAERSGDFPKAVELYFSIPPSAAPSLDARLALLRLRTTGIDFGERKNIPPTPAEADFGEALKSLEADLRAYYRKDLLAELLLITAKGYEAQGKIDLALKTYGSIRGNEAKSPTAVVARETTARLRAEFPEVVLSRADRIEEIEILTAEGTFAEALAMTQALQREDKPNTSSYLETKVLEEKILRRMKRNEEADEVLLQIATSDDSAFASTALLRVARNAWNINDQHRALEFLGKLAERFPKSTALGEAKYIEGRILEELGILPDAKDAYIALSTGNAAPSEKLRALRRLAWLYLINDDSFHAAQYFSEMRKVAGADLSEIQKKEISDKVLKEGNERSDDFEHASYWLAFTAKGLSSVELTKLGLLEGESQRLWVELAAKKVPSYYALLSANRLGQTASFLMRQNPEVEPKNAETYEKVQAEISAISGRPDFREILAYELDWHLGHSSSRANFPATKMARSLLHHHFGSFNIGVSEADSLLRNARWREEVLTAVLADGEELLSAAYPDAFRSEFEKALSSTSIAPELLKGIARTESHFDPLAVSSVGALGLAQLMPATAKGEGWNGVDTLFDPRLNLVLAAKHLQQLRANFPKSDGQVIAAYNAGSAAVNRWRYRFPNLEEDQWVEQITYPETYNYVRRVKLAQMVYRARQDATQFPAISPEKNKINPNS